MTDLKEKWTADAQDRLRAEVRAVLERKGIRQKDAAAQVGRPMGTWTAWLGGNYAGLNEEVAEDTEKWLLGLREAEVVQLSLPAEPEWLATPTAQRFLDTLIFCHRAPTFGIVAGRSGLGKTKTARHYQSRATNVHIITCMPMTSSAHVVMGEVADAIGVTAKGPRLVGEVMKRLPGSKALLIFDEAQHLSRQALEQIRSVYDLTRTGVVLIGNRDLLTTLSAKDNESQFARLTSRAGKRTLANGVTSDDVDMVAGAMGVSGEAELKMLRAIAAKPIGLHGVVNVVQQASVFAGGEPITRKHLSAAWDDLGAAAFGTAA